jgi:bacterioferritin
MEINPNQFAAELPYPPIRIENPNLEHANLILSNAVGQVSEFTSFAQYTNHEIRLSKDFPDTYSTLLGVSLVELRHFQMLGELVILLGGEFSYSSKSKDKITDWTPKYVNYGNGVKEMLKADIAAEEAAILQYEKTINIINDDYIDDILKRIVLDERIHLVLFDSIYKKYFK